MSYKFEIEYTIKEDLDDFLCLIDVDMKEDFADEGIEFIKIVPKEITRFNNAGKELNFNDDDNAKAWVLSVIKDNEDFKQVCLEKAMLMRQDKIEWLQDCKRFGEENC